MNVPTSETPAVGGHDFGVPYAEEPPLETAAPFTARTSADGRRVIVEGHCPRCQGRTVSELPRGIPGGGGTKGMFSRLSGRDRPRAAHDPAAEVLSSEVFFCECGYAHPQQPADVSFMGCGASWRAVAPSTDGGDGR
ncbi:hypothetical protein [Streptomyces sp. NPDC046261]|uniref:hypothetical protein n=1 Tax=Streptomyces sp. NPDC046261 TaxID=3157200 RepID=UPI0033F46EDD